MISEMTTTGIEHYILGRYAFCSGYFNTVGINTHRAFELILKVSILKSTNDLNVKQYGHNLVKIYKKHCTERNIDPTSRLKFMDALQAFEKMRYPDSLNGQAVQIQLASKVISGTLMRFGNEPLMTVGFNLHENDLVFREILEQASINPELVKTMAKGQSKDALFNGNESFTRDIEAKTI